MGDDQTKNVVIPGVFPAANTRQVSADYVALTPPPLSAPDLASKRATGMPMLLIPFSFDFANAVCIAVLLGFFCEATEIMFSRLSALGGNYDGPGSTAAVRDHDEEGKSELECETGEPTTTTTAGGEGPRSQDGISYSTSASLASRYGAPPIGPTRAAPSELPFQRPRRAGPDDAESESVGSRGWSPSLKPLRGGLLMMQSKVSRDRSSGSTTRRVPSRKAARPRPARAEEETPLPQAASSVHWSLAAAAASGLVISAILGMSEGG